MKIRYDSPVILSFAIISAIISILSLFMPINQFLAFPGKFYNLISFLQVFTAGFSHANFNHLLGNMSLFLLLGPLLEEKYGSKKIFLMIFETLLLTAVINSIFIKQPVLGASGIVFMMIALAGIGKNSKNNEINLSFILIALLFSGSEIVGIFKNDGISHFSHLMGGVCGAILGYFHTKNVEKEEIV